ncbi:MAG: bifunctional nuclease family protein [Candidatus Methylomirabilis sp.]
MIQKFVDYFFARYAQFLTPLPLGEGLGEGAACAGTPSPSPSPPHRGEGKLLREFRSRDIGKRHRVTLHVGLLSAFLLSFLLLAPPSAPGAEEPKGLHEMEVLGVANDQETGQPTVLLRGKQGKQELTLFIGPFEAQGIAVPLQQIKPPRPLTHDLALSFLSTFHSRLRRVIISDLKENTYYATLYLEVDGKELTLDSRPSDAIALALRAGVPIYANDKALGRTRPGDTP